MGPISALTNGLRSEAGVAFCPPVNVTTIHEKQKGLSRSGVQWLAGTGIAF